MRDNRQSYRLELAHVVTPTPANELQIAIAQLSLDAWALIWSLVDEPRPSELLVEWEGVLDDLEQVLAHALANTLRRPALRAEVQ